MAEAESSILIVDDDADDLSALKKALDSLGCNLHTVTDPHDVLPAVYREQPDVVVLDALLPGLSGFDLCKQIKSDGELKGTQVVIITGVYLRQQYRQEALQQFKADGFLTKPFRAPELQRLVVELLAKKTRKPQASFLQRLGLPLKTPSPKKRGLFGRFFRKEEPTPERIAPVARARTSELPKSRSGKVPSPESAPDSVETMPDTAAPSAAAADAADEDKHPEEKASEPKVEEPVETAAASDDVTAPEPEAAEAAATRDEKAEEKPRASESSQSDAPETREPVDDTPESEATGGVDESASSVPSGSLASSKSTATQADHGLDATPAADEPAANEKDGIEGKTEPPVLRPPEPQAAPSAEDEAESKTQPKAEEETDAATAEADKDPSRVEKPEPDAVSSPLAVQRPRFRVGDVPIFDEEDFYFELKRELSKCRRVDRPLTLILIQVDDLTQIVELFGKEIREAVLWHVAKKAMASLREVDLAGMMSSRELIALTAFASDKYGGGRVVARVRKLIAKNPFRVSEELPPIVPALQFGMSSFPEDGDEVVGLITKAYEDIAG